MKHVYTTKHLYFLFSFLVLLSTTLQAQKVAYDYDMAGNRISSKVVNLDNPNYLKKQTETHTYVEVQLAERMIMAYSNPSKKFPPIEMLGGEVNDK
jgi:hypothetical protein